jgi:hypothetical protein
MSDVKTSHSAPTLRSPGRSEPGQVVLVLQGGGALGSYQAGVYQALHEAGIEPDWIIGTSIGRYQRQLDRRQFAAEPAVTLARVLEKDGAESGLELSRHISGLQ